MAGNDSNNSLLPTFATTAPVIYNRGGAIHISGLSLMHDGGRTLFENAHVTLNHGSITALVGTNGAGKTSLARILSSKHLNGFPSNLVVEYLAASDDEEYLAGTNNDNNDDTSLMLSLKPIDYIERRVKLRTEQLSNQIEQLESQLDNENLQQEELERISDQLAIMFDLEEGLKEKVHRELHRALDELGLRQHQDRTLKELSSGWRFKCRLVAAFLIHPDLLIIDEPSFLDEQSTEWFVSRTKEAALTDNAMVLLISHKEALLETLCDTVLYINSANKTLTTYHCGYESFRSTHEDRVESAQKKIAGAEQNTKAITGEKSNLKATTSENSDQRFIKGKNKEAKQKADKSAAAKVKLLKKKAGELEEARIHARTERVKPLHLESVPVDGKVISLQDVATSYDPRDGVVFEYVDVCMEATDKVLLKGKNGCGKSTLVKVILGKLQPTSGSVNTVTGNIVYFPQVALSDLLRWHGSECSVDFLGRDDLSVTESRHHLGKFGLDKDLATRPINTLSAGQRVRLWLAREELRHPKPSLLIVDEISENVDRETRDSLVQLISTFEAAVLVISHDSDFCSRLNVTKEWELFPFGIRETYASRKDGVLS
ncbi:hypothetical protein ACHAWC_006820 [Mediolabrus comicus]